MILRALTVAGALVGGATASQFPEFSQQYVQRLGGAVDALGQVVADFDASAKAEGLNRDAALAAMVGSDFVERRRTDMTATMARHAKLERDLTEMMGAGPFMRAYHSAGLDGEIAKAAWRAYQPAVPLTRPGLVFAAVGFLLGGTLVGGAGRTGSVLIRAVFRRTA